MYIQPVAGVRPGDTLAQTVFDERGRPLLHAGVALDEDLIARLLQRGVASVYLRDGLADDVPPEQLVQEQLRAEIATTLSEAFDSITSSAESVTEKAPDVATALGRLGPRPLPLTDKTQQQLKALHGHAASLVEQIMDAPTVGNLASLKSHSLYTFQHSVDVAVISVLLGVRAGLPLNQLRDLALGALLHDVGKRYIDQAILDHPGKLSPEQRAAVQEHPRMGFELLRRLPLTSILPPHVAYQHHERQNGTGYPRGLTGSNRLMQWSAERAEPDRMMLIAEITAVADVYSAIASDRPYRPAMPPEQVTTTLAGMAGMHLNRAVLELFNRSVPLYPVGLWITVVSGRYEGWRGVVSELHRTQLNRPQLRLLLDARGEAVADPVEVDLLDQPSVEIRSLNPGRAPMLSRNPLMA